MQKIFVDTSAWVAICDSKDAHHQQAIAFSQQIARKYQLVVTNYILDETYTLLLMNAGYQQAIALKKKFDLLIQTNILQVVWVSEEIAAQAWTVFEQFNVDKQWSFTDCVSYVVMTQQKITEAFTLDHHFSQMGFLRRPS